MLTASEFQQLKTKVKAEMARRGAYGSLAGYAAAAYDFSSPPVSGGLILAEHGQKTIDLLLKIKDYPGLKAVKAGEVIPDTINSGIISSVNALASEPMQGNSSSCREPVQDFV